MINGIKRLWKEWHNTYRVVVLNDNNLEEIFALKLTRRNLYSVFSVMTMLFFVLTWLLIALTPLREYIPGYGNFNVYRRAVALKNSTDSIAQKVQQQAQYLTNVRNLIFDTSVVMSADTQFLPLPAPAETLTKADSINLLQINPDEQQFRTAMEAKGDVLLNKTPGSTKRYFSGLADMYLTPPAEGHIARLFDPEKGHLGIDVSGGPNPAIYAIADGLVILADYTLENGYVLLVQHNNNLLSVYKDNAGLLKKNGDAVKAGDAIALMGDKGDMEGPHLHFELWIDQKSVNPTDYILFD